MATFGILARRLPEIAFNRLTSGRTMSRLLEVDSPVVRSVAQAIDAALHGRASAEERTWVERIESLRAGLRASSTEISVLDYGARDPRLNLSAEQMYQGTVWVTTIGEKVRRSGVRPRKGFLLFKLVRELRPSACLELGTSLGISTAYEAAALELNDHGRIITLEGSDVLASLAREHFDRLGLQRVEVVVGRFQDNLGRVMREQGSVDLAFIDGHHTEGATLAYFEGLVPFLSGRGVLVFDDIYWSGGMTRAWERIAADRRVRVSVDLFSVGICVLDSALEGKHSFKVPLV